MDKRLSTPKKTITKFGEERMTQRRLSCGNAENTKRDRSESEDQSV
jgi:hypothetical protein